MTTVCQGGTASVCGAAADMPWAWDATCVPPREAVAGVPDGGAVVATGVPGAGACEARVSEPQAEAGTGAFVHLG